MRPQTTDDPNRLNPGRTVAIATAIAVHVGAVLFLLAPARPQAQAQLEDPGTTNVIFVEPPIEPPPPPPVQQPEPPPTPPLPARMPPPLRPLPVREPTTNTLPATMTDDSAFLSDEPVTDPVVPTLLGDSFADARADARYSGHNRVRYPTAAIRNREQGEVLLRVLISSNGSPRQAEVARSSGSRHLDAAAKRSVLSWRFVPAERNGSAIDTWVIVPIRFNLSEA